MPCVLSGVAAYCAIDTGAAPGVIVTKQFADAHPRILSDIFVTDYLYGLRERSRTRFGVLDSLELGGVTIRHEVAGFSMANHGVLAGTHYFDALIGNPVLQQFNVTFDYANAKLYLAPTPTQTAR